MTKLVRKKVKHLEATKNYMGEKGVKISQQNILWIIGRFMHYAVAAIVHGHTVILPDNMRFSMYYVYSSDFEYIDKQSMFARSGAIHGVFFSILCKGKIPDKFKALFKPSLAFRRLMEEHLDNPDLAYKLIT